MRRWVVVGVLAAVVAALPGSAMAADCAMPGIPGEYDAFVRNNWTGVNTQISGRAAVGGNVSMQGANVGGGLPQNASRVDLIAGNDLAVGP
jgi:Putative Ice-binding-like adhesive domain